MSNIVMTVKWLVQENGRLVSKQQSRVWPAPDLLMFDKKGWVDITSPLSIVQLMTDNFQFDGQLPMKSVTDVILSSTEFDDVDIPIYYRTWAMHNGHVMDAAGHGTFPRREQKRKAQCKSIW